MKQETVKTALNLTVQFINLCYPSNVTASGSDTVHS